MPQLKSDEANIKQQVAEKLGAFETATLRVLALTVLVVYGLRLVTSFLLFEFHHAFVTMIPIMVSIAFSASILFALFKKRLALRYVRPVTTALGTVVTFNVFYILHVADNPAQLYFAALILTAYGLGSASLTMWFSLFVPFAVAYITSLVILDLGSPLPFIAMLVGSTAISIVAYFVRVPAIRQLTELEVRNAEARRKLETSNKAKDQFLANMTHELRTPMTGVIGMIDLLADTKLDKDQTLFLGTARKSARYLMTVINDILDVTKLGAGKVSIKPEPMDAIALTHEIVSLFELRAHEKQLSLIVDLPKVSHLPVLGDQIRISQILLNLLENALKFTSTGEIRIILTTETDSETSKLTWSVKDSGAGIASDRLPTLFDRFEQADSSATRTTHGTGLGLAIIKDLVNLMQGEFGAESELGKGSRFWFALTLPTINRAALPAAPATPLSARFLEAKPIEFAAKDMEVETPPPNVKQLRILYAEDNPVNQELIGRILKHEGWEAEAVCNGQEAVDAIAQTDGKYDLVLMDIQMPVLDGVAALGRIKAENNKAPPVIALTANTLPDDVQRYNEAGFDAIVGKPIDIKKLRETVLQLTGTQPE